jgi:hypothetical protein
MTTQDKTQPFFLKQAQEHAAVSALGCFIKILKDDYQPEENRNTLIYQVGWWKMAEMTLGHINTSLGCITVFARLGIGCRFNDTINPDPDKLNPYQEMKKTINDLYDQGLGTLPDEVQELLTELPTRIQFKRVNGIIPPGIPDTEQAYLIDLESSFSAINYEHKLLSLRQLIEQKAPLTRILDFVENW